MKITKGRCCVYGIEYHIVWCTKYRREVISGDVEKRFHEILYNYASNNDFEIIAMNGEADHIHMLISATPNTVIPNILKGMKGLTAKMLLREFPELKSKLYGGHMWSPSYFICTVSEKTEQNVKNYIESQKDA